MGTDQLPFTRKRGVLYVAPLGAELPDNSVGGGRFVMTWPTAWILVDPSEMTVPAACRVSGSSMAVWDFGPCAAMHLRRWNEGWARWNLHAVPRFMLGWESEDGKDRLIAGQVFADDAGCCHLEWVGREEMSLFTWHRARTTEEHNAEIGGRA